MNIKDFLAHHTIIEIGNKLPGYICCETIVDDPIRLISTVQLSNNYISEIRWWDHVKICAGSDIGYGGPRDPHSPKEYFYAETDIVRTFTPSTNEEEYLHYMQEIKNKYPRYQLFPAFNIKEDKGTVLLSPDEDENRA